MLAAIDASFQSPEVSAVPPIALSSSLLPVPPDASRAFIFKADCELNPAEAFSAIIFPTFFHPLDFSISETKFWARVACLIPTCWGPIFPLNGLPVVTPLREAFPSWINFLCSIIKLLIWLLATGAIALLVSIEDSAPGPPFLISATMSIGIVGSFRRSFLVWPSS